MENKYNLKQMLEEIKLDEAVAPRRSKTISQKEITEMVARKRKEAKNAGKS